MKSLTETLNENYISLDSSRGWMIYWLTHFDELLDENYIGLSHHINISSFQTTKEENESDQNLSKFYSDEFVQSLVLTFSGMQNCYGGFGGNTGRLSHVLSTYAAVFSLIMSGDERALKLIDRMAMYNFLLSMKDESTGGFTVHEDGEIDVRGFYCATAIASILQIVTNELFEGVDKYILSCICHDGGFGGEFGAESHGGYTYCGIASLCLLNKAYLIDLDSLLRWASLLQQGVEGGFQGRVNKLADSCYSFWVGAIFPCIKEAYRQCNRKTPEHCFFDSNALQAYTYICCQMPNGGFRDKPGKPRDFYHSCYAASGISIAQSNEGSTSETPRSKGKNSKYYEIPMFPNYRLAPTDPFYNVRPDKILIAREYFSQYPLILNKAGEIGTEGAGYTLYCQNSQK